MDRKTCPEAGSLFRITRLVAKENCSEILVMEFIEVQNFSPANRIARNKYNGEELELYYAIKKTNVVIS